MLSPSEFMLHTTIRLTAARDGTPLSHATGFFYRFETDRGAATAIITNKHALEGADSIHLQIRVTALDRDSPSFEVKCVDLEITDAEIVSHPDPNVDLCVICVDWLITGIRLKGRDIQVSFLDRSWIPTLEEWTSFDALEELVMVGCPNGAFDQVNGLPTMTRSTTATHLAYPFNGVQEFLIDAACLPGSSGSPVFLYNLSGHYSKASGRMIYGETRHKLLGVLHAGHVIVDDTEVASTKKLNPRRRPLLPFGWVIRSTRILELEPLVQDLVAAQYGKV